ncbi:MAG: hypothetical protein EXS08_15675 [Planctomycetes bacterium]|nr:hypothetical protein [Planctomycetota bacterium]
MWRSLSGKPIPDLIAATQELLRGDREVIHVGSDSQNYGQATNYVTVVAVLDPGHGGRVFYQRSSIPRAQTLAHKLFLEAELSLDTALFLSRAFAHDIVVHVDVNQDIKHKSSQYVRALAGMVLGHGFQVRVKPDSWAATHLADSLVKGKHFSAA